MIFSEQYRYKSCKHYNNDNISSVRYHRCETLLTSDNAQRKESIKLTNNNNRNKSADTIDLDIQIIIQLTQTNSSYPKVFAIIIIIIIYIIFFIYFATFKYTNHVLSIHQLDFLSRQIVGMYDYHRMSCKQPQICTLDSLYATLPYLQDIYLCNKYLLNTKNLLILQKYV